MNYLRDHIIKRLMSVAVFLIGIAAGFDSNADAPPTRLPDEPLLREGLVLKAGRSAGRARRAAIHQDALEAEIVGGRWRAPQEGDAVEQPDGSMRGWEKATAGDNGEFTDLGAGGYLFVNVSVPGDRTMILEASGHRMVYVNGEPRAGDPYQTNYVRLPVWLHAGNNDLLFHASRGRVRASLVAPKVPVTIDLGDTTLPDFSVGERAETWCGVVVLNASNDIEKDLQIESASEGSEPVTTALPPLLPLSVRKVAVRLNSPGTKEAGTCDVSLTLSRTSGEKTSALDRAGLKLRVREPHQTHNRTFISEIDGSVQYYAVNPATRAAGMGVPGAQIKPALFLSLHGAGVEAIGQADAYENKSWGHLVSPTNRRPYGFDWEDWGRLDALEVLSLAQRSLGTDPTRTYLTGHSMGGHGVWHLGATFPDRFAAIGPSAGWISMWSYAGASRPQEASPIDELLARSTSASDTLALSPNYAQQGVYVLHGNADDNVPVAQARQMKERLSTFHRDFAYHEQPGAGHWWDDSDEPGASCVDWAPMFDFFARHVIPSNESVRQVEFTTANPGVSSVSHWVAIEAQARQGTPSTVTVRFDPGQRRFVGKTDNVFRVAFDLRHLAASGPVRVELDGQTIEKIDWPAAEPRIWLERASGTWSITVRPSPALKGPHRNGLFKDAFRNRVMFVYGTRGTAEENAWSFAKARFDAETFWYQGNGSIDVVADRDFDASAERDRNVIVYGNASTNAAWGALLSESPVQVTREHVQVGDRTEARSDLACLFLRPRPGSDRASVGVVSGTSLAGCRLTDRLSYFTSGVGYPDVFVLSSEALSKGAAGVLAAGFFGLDWGVSSGEFAWTKPKEGAR